MKTNFFSQLASTGVKQVNLTLFFNDNDLTVAIIPQSQCEDKGLQQLIPLTFTDTIENIDEAFFAKISEPLNQTSELISNLEHFQAQIQQAKNQSDMEKKKKEEIKKKEEELKKIVGEKEFTLNDKTAIKLRKIIAEILETHPDSKLALKWDKAIKKNAQANLFA